MPVLEIILRLMPLLISIVQAIEKAIPEKGNGTEKLNAVNNMISAALKADPCVSGETERLVMPVVENLTIKLVTTFNETGAFNVG